MEISNSTRLSSVLTRAIKVFSPKIVIETGTYLGTGSTRTILEAFGHRRPQAFYTIEVSKQFHEVARRNLSNWPFVHCLWGLSVDKQQALDFVANDPFLKELDPKLDIYVDFLPDPAAGYMNEIHGGLGDSMDMEAPQGLLGSLIEQHKQDRPMICLDSAGGLGWMEFQGGAAIAGGKSVFVVPG